MTTTRTEEDAASPVVLRATGIRAGYGDKEVLGGIGFELRRGERLAVVGPSGCGKSTLLKVLCGLLEPWDGTVELAGEDLWGQDEAGRARLLRRLGVVFQHGGLLGSLTLAENLALARMRWDRLPEEPVLVLARARLAQVGLEGTEHLLPAELSGGMLRRAAVARALMCDPELLVCDEPTAGLDPTVAAGVDALLAGLPALTGATLLMVSHDLASIRTVATRILVMEAGQFVAEGTWDQLTTSSHSLVRDFFSRSTHRSTGGSKTLADLLFGN